MWEEGGDGNLEEGDGGNSYENIFVRSVLPCRPTQQPKGYRENWQTPEPRKKPEEKKKPPCGGGGH